MLRIIWFFRGYAAMEICGAAPEWALNRLTGARIPFWNVQWTDPLTVRICILKRDIQQAEEMIQAAMCEHRILSQDSLLQRLRLLVRRPVLLVMVFLSLMSALILPYFVFFYEVEGNENVSESEILRELENAGIGFGTFGPSIYPRRVKDHMIAALPELEWVTVVQHGCRATVVVREREPVPETNSKKGFANVVATQSGIITQRSVFTGQAVCQVGDTVNKGDILVSGVVDLERTYLLERAYAEIFARTWRGVEVCVPTTCTEKSMTGESDCCVWLILGKKRIKIFGNSGISYAGCDKMIDKKMLCLPNGLKLPVSLEIETVYPFVGEPSEMPRDEAQDRLLSYAVRTVSGSMRAGQILDCTHRFIQRDGIYRVDVTLECHEMIAETVDAKWSDEVFFND